MPPGRRLPAVVAGAIVAGVVLGFSLFLYSHGVGLLPSSVLAKSGLTLLHRLPGLDTVWNNVEQQLFFVVIALFAAALFVREGRAREAVLLVLAPTAAHLLFGRYGWFARYHIYFATWIVILFVTIYARAGLVRLRFLSAALALWFAYASLDSMIATLTTPAASRNIADQQKQMAIIARDSTNPQAAARLRQALANYRKSAPQAAMMLELSPP